MIEWRLNLQAEEILLVHLEMFAITVEGGPRK